MLLQIAKTLGSTSIKHRSDTFVSDRCLTVIDSRVFAIWEMYRHLKSANKCSTAQANYRKQKRPCWPFLKGIHGSQVISPHKGPLIRMVSTSWRQNGTRVACCDAQWRRSEDDTSISAIERQLASRQAVSLLSCIVVKKVLACSFIPIK